MVVEVKMYANLMVELGHDLASLVSFRW